MLKKGNFSFILIFLLTNSCTNYKNELSTFLPTQDEIKGWVLKDKPEIYSKTQLYDYIDGGAEIFFKYGFDSLITQEYCCEDNSIVIEIYKMASSKSASRIYSYNRNPKFPPLLIGKEGGDEGCRILFWQDRYYVVIQTFNERQEIKPTLLAMAKTVSAKIYLSLKSGYSP